MAKFHYCPEFNVLLSSVGSLVYSALPRKLVLQQVRQPSGVVGGAKVLGKLPEPGRPTIWITVGQGLTVLAVCVGWGCLDIFTLVCPFSSLSPSLWETARYRLKYCLKGPLNPKQPTNYRQPSICNALAYIHIWLDDWRCYVLFNSISVISGQWTGDSEIEFRLRLRRFHLERVSNPGPLDQ